MDQVCMYEYFSNYVLEWDSANREVKKLRKRKNAVVIIPTPYFKNTMDNEYWCYQMLMLFTPFRNHAEVLVYPTYRDLTNSIIADPTDDQESHSQQDEHPEVNMDEFSALRLFDPESPVPVDTSSETGPPVTQPTDPRRQCRLGEEEEEILPDIENPPDDNVPDLTCGLPVTQAILEDIAEEEPVQSSDFLSQPVFADSELGQTGIDSDTVAARRPFKSASTLLKLVMSRGLIHPAFSQTCGVLDLLEGYMKDAFADSVTMPTEAEVIMRLREIGYDDENAFCIDELMTKMALDHNLRQQRKVTGEIQPERRFFLGKHYDTFITDFNEAAKIDGKSSKRTQNDNQMTGPISTEGTTLKLLEQHRDQISNTTGIYASLKLRQKVVLLMLLDTLEDMIRQSTAVNQSLSIRTCRLVLQGEAGTGKTFVLKQAVKLMCLFLDPQCIRVFAPTAHAAKTYQDLPCGSSTFHKVWSKGWGADSSGSGRVESQLIGTRLQSWASLMNGVKALICDEMSMISPLDVDLMSRRLTSVPRTEGGLPGGPFNDLPIVILCGDLYQLPPVKAWSLYHGEFDIAEKGREESYLKLSEHQRDTLQEKWSHHNRGLELYRTFFDKCVILNENVRQEGDQAWRYLLKRVRSGEATDDDTRFLNDHVRDETELLPSRCENAHKWQTCKRFYPTVNMVLEEGLKMFQSAFPNLSDQFDASPIIHVNKKPAEHKEVRKYGTDINKTAYPLKLAVGAPVMVTSNVAVAREWGIVNGSTGTVVGYVTRDGVVPTYVLVQIDSVLAGMPPLTITPPPGPSSKRIVFRNTWPFAMCMSTAKKAPLRSGRNAPLDSIAIRYFPLTLAYALTIHKAQGMTEDFAIVDIKQDG